ncbi:unnamed protein product [Alopecurus aequalis]
MEGPVNELDRWLTNGDEQLKVSAIVGIAGVGKTTLAQKLWGKLRGQFECRAFVRTAQKPNMRGIISSILSQVRPHQPPDPGDMNHLISHLREYLQDKRYFVIIDDLWATSVWDVLSRAFPEGRCCSRIITTTEIMDVARACCGYCPDYIFQMEFLSDVDSEKLLLQRVILGNQSPQRFDHILPHIVRKCGGLPLAIIMVASLIASRPEKLDRLGLVQNSVGSTLGLRAHPTTDGFMGQLLNVSFDTLPHYLKTCLLYLSTCPEGYIFLKDDLVKQWMAEDVICAHSGGDMEEVARSYFDELVTMGLIQVLDINYDYELLSYSVHHMILDLIAYKAIEENFVTVLDYSQTAMLLPDKVRRLSLHFGSATYATTPASTRLSQVRSLFFFGLFNCMPPFVGFKHLRVLNLHIWGDLGNTSFDLTGVCELFRLRYLQVTCNVTVKLPDQIEAMKHLETLEINSRVYAIPPDIVHLPRLLHLRLRGGTSLPHGIGSIRSLRTLTYFGLGNNSEDNLWGLGELTNLRDLHFTYSTLPSREHLKRNLMALASSLGKLCNLRSLTLAPGTARMVGLFDGSSDMPSAPVFLERLELLPPICIFSRLPKWIGRLRKICIVKVAVKELLTDDIDILAGLPSLTVLSLCVKTAPEGRIIFNQGAFLVLKYFEFRCGVLCLSFMAGAMPNLQRLNLSFNTHIGEKYINMLAGLEHLLNLQDITGRIGADTESDRRAAEAAFKEAVSKHPMCPRSSIQRVDPVENEYRPSEKQKTSYSVFFPEKSVRTCFFCSRRRATKMRQSDTATKGGANRTENKKQQLKLRIRLNDVLRKNQLQSLYSGASVKNKVEDPHFFITTSSPPNSQTIHVASEREEQMLPDAMKQEYPDSNIISKQDLLAKVKKNEEEIVHLRRNLVDYSVKEAQILNDKLDLERRIAHMRKEFDQQQLDFVDSASEALSYRQNIIEEQIRLTYALQAARQGRSKFISSLLPILSENNLQPSVCDAQSIVSSLKVLFEHLQEKLIVTEEKLKESHNQIAPGNTSGHVQSPSIPPGNALVSSSPISSVRTRHAWDLSSDEKLQVIPTDVAATNTEHDNVGRTSPSSSQITKDPLRSDGSENIEGAKIQTSQKPPAVPPNFASGLDDENLPYTDLRTSLEESSSSLSQEDDPLPAIDGLRITGEAFPGRVLQASGYSINGTTSCIFKWVRYLEDGSINFIEAANQPTYLVTADDVDTLLSIEIQPLDTDRKRKGEIVKFYANEQEKIPCDPEMKELIKKILSIGNVSYEVLLPIKYIDMWEPAVLSIKRDGYRIKYTGQGGVIITEKFTQATSINIPYGRPNELSIKSAYGVEYFLKPAESSPSRDSITLILRLFQIKAVQRSKIRRRSGGGRRARPRRPLHSPKQVHMSGELRRPQALAS